MSTVIIGAGDNVRNAVTQVENASLGWTQTQRDDAEAMLMQFASCLKAVADGGDASLVSLTGP